MSPAGASRRRIVWRRWRPNCASSARPWTRAPISCASRRRAAGSPRRLRSIPTTITAWRCAFRCWRLAVCRCVSTIRSASTRPSRRISTRWRISRSVPRMTGLSRSERMIPVIAIDGPSASGKGTVAQRAAQRLGFHYLDSGAIYRAAGLAARQAGVALDDQDALVQLAHNLELRFDGERVLLAGQDVSIAVRGEQAGKDASAIAALPRLRQALLDRQRAFRVPPGLVADGRDMGSVVFADAQLKIFLTASPEARAERRVKQLIEKGIPASIEKILEDLRERDARDAARSAAPLKMCDDAVLLDTTQRSIDEAVQFVVQRFHAVARQAVR